MARSIVFFSCFLCRRDRFGTVKVLHCSCYCDKHQTSWSSLQGILLKFLVTVLALCVHRRTTKRKEVWILLWAQLSDPSGTWGSRETRATRSRRVLPALLFPRKQVSHFGPGKTCLNAWQCSREKKNLTDIMIVTKRWVGSSIYISRGIEYFINDLYKKFN